MTPQQYLDTLYPWFNKSEDLRFVSPDQMASYLTIAGGYAPTCLSLEKQNEAVAHYAAYLAQTGINEEAGLLPAQQVKREKEGDVEVEYVSSASSSAGIMAPINAYQKWLALFQMCRTGGIVVSTAIPVNPSFPYGIR